MADVDHIQAAQDALDATQGRDAASVQAHATLALAHAVLALAKHLDPGAALPRDTATGTQEPAALPQSAGLAQVVTVQLGGTIYHLERLQDGTIRALNTSVPAYEAPTKPVLRRINEEKQLGVDLYRPNGAKKNTRTLGRDVMRALLDQNKAMRNKSSKPRPA